MSWNDAQCDACSRPWDVLAEMGCVHEHMGQVRLCVDHRNRLDEDRLYCTPCVNDHPCTLSVITLTPALAVSS